MVFWVAGSESIILTRVPTKVRQMQADRKGVSCVELKRNFYSIE